MRTLGFGLVLLGGVWGLSFGCGTSERGGARAAGAAGEETAGSNAGSAGKPGPSATAGTSSSGGGSSGGGGSSSGGGATMGGHGDAQAGAGNEAGASAALVDCDPKKILCKRLAPDCELGEVPSVEGSCYGDCVKIERCGCSAAAECPQPEQYACWSAHHCGPFVK